MDKSRGTNRRDRRFIIGANTADLHFAAFNPEEQYKILREQFINPLITIQQLDYILISGDLYDRKLMGNSDGLYYASLFIADVVALAKLKEATVIIIHGTYSHDADQLKNLYHYMSESGVDVRIVTQIQFEEVDGFRILCIPELYGLDESIYQKYLHYSGYYDACFMHGTIKGAIAKDNVGNGRLFTIHDFDMCRGYIIAGHVHTPGCFRKYFYYTGSPYRWEFGQEEEKGFLLTSYDRILHQHHVQFVPIKSSSYITITLEQLVANDPKQTIDYIDRLKREQGIDYLRIKFNIPISPADKTFISSHYRNNGMIRPEFLSIAEERKMEQEKQGDVIDDKLSFILDKGMSEYEKLVRFINLYEGDGFITVEGLKDLLSDNL